VNVRVLGLVSINAGSLIFAGLQAGVEGCCSYRCRESLLQDLLYAKFQGLGIIQMDPTGHVLF
jgi:hypothetical protein